MNIQLLNNYIKLNNEQYDIVSSDINKYMCILSCAGSGKTRTLISRILYMIDKYKCKPENFFIVTYTKNAATDIKNKLSTYVNNNYFCCGTFHSIGYNIIKKYAPDMIPLNLHIDESQYIFYDFLQSNRSQEFKDQIKYILVDEFQDINELQFNIIKILSQNAISLIVVGDDLQNIYTFRGSSIEYIYNFNKAFNNSITKELSKNYRSSLGIINVANYYVNQMNSKKSLMESDNNILEKPKLVCLDSLSSEINYVINEVKQLINNNVQLHNICIMCRNNQPLYFVEEILMKYNIKNIMISSEFKSNINYLYNHIVLTTIHGSKGLEYDYVYLIGMNDIYFPYDNNINEEKRLLYVAITRCKQKLTLTYSNNSGLSRFIDNNAIKLFDHNILSTKIISLPDKLDKDIYLTSIIRKLNGDDYMYMRKNNILPTLTPITNNYYSEYKYPKFIIRNGLFSEFGWFIDYMIRRMIAQHNVIKNRDYFMDKKANAILFNIYLTDTEYDIYNRCKIIFSNNIININSRNECQILLTKHNIKMMAENKEILYDIIKRVKYVIEMFDISIDKITITKNNYLPINFLIMYREMYKKYIDVNVSWKDIIYYIFQISKCHHFYFNRRKSLYIQITENDLLELGEWLLDVEKYVTNYIVKHNVLLDTSLSNSIIGADADIIISKTNDYTDTTIIDIKNSNNNTVNLEHIIQLLGYTILAREKGMIINNIEIFNPLNGNQYIYNISEWNGDKLKNYLLDRIN